MCSCVYPANESCRRKMHALVDVKAIAHTTSVAGVIDVATVRTYFMTGRSVFFSVNSSESRRFDFSEAQCIMQLPPVWSNETLKFPTGKASVVTDMGTGGNSEDWPFSVCFLIIKVQLL